MTWLTPWTGAILAAAVIPPLILLYILKLRRKTQPIASTLLWKKAIEDLRANAPFQKLRRSLLLLLQLIALSLLALAVMQPQLQAGKPKRGKTVFLIDNSASMTASDGPEGITRLVEAKRLARQRVESLYAGGLFSRSPGETMIVAFSDRAEILCRFTNSKQQLLNAIDAIEPTHGESRIAEALKLARAYTTNVDPDNPDRPIGEPAALELFSDGRIADLSDQVLRGEVMSYQPLGSPKADNVAIAAISVERPYDRPTAVQVFVALLNFNPEPAKCSLQLAVNGDVLVGGLEDIDIPATEIDPSTNQPVPGRNNIVFAPFEQPRDAVIEVRNLRPDDLAADNVARLVIPPARQLKVALVASKGFILKLALEGLTALRGFDLLSAEQFQQFAAQDELGQYDVIVLDNYAPSSLPPGRYLSFGATPPLEGLNDYGVKDQLQSFLDTRDEHPLLRFVNLGDVLFEHARLIQPADDVVVLAEASSGSPAIIEVRRGGLAMIHLTFDLLDSTFPTHRGFPTFIFNAIDYLGHLGEALTVQGLAPGQAVTARLPAAATNVSLVTPDDRTHTIAATDPTQVSWGPIRVSGLHLLKWSMPDASDPQVRPFAVNLFSQTEGDIAPRTRIELSQDKVEGRLGDDSAYTSLWPWAIGVCLTVLMLEWWVYHRKTFI